MLSSIVRRSLTSPALRTIARSATTQKTVETLLQNTVKTDAVKNQKRFMSGSMDKMESGTKMYMSLYPEGSTDGG